LGFIAGALLLSATYQQVFPRLSQIGNYGAVTLPDLLHVNTWLAVILFVEIVLVLFYFFEKKGIK